MDRSHLSTIIIESHGDLHAIGWFLQVYLECGYFGWEFD